MSNIIKYKNIEAKIIEIRKQKVLLDFDVAEIYGVDTKRVNEAVKNNPNKFPDDYLFPLTNKEFSDLRSKISTTKLAKTRVAPKVFTEKGLYMITTILKSKQAVNATFAIIETFAKIRKLKQTINALSANPEKQKQKSLMQKSGKLISELFDDDLQTNETETTIELNFAVLKFKHTIKKK